MLDEKKKTYLLIFLITLFRLIYINLVPLVPQEAYYWKYAKHPALSYFDHPPMAAWMIALFTWIGGDSLFFIRLGSVLYSAGLMLLVHQIAWRLFRDEKLAFWSVAVINCTVLFSIGATVITPDVPLLFFWALMTFSLVRLIESDHPGWWYLAGVALGLGLLSKYSAILIVPGIFIFLLLSPKHRRWLATVHPYAAVVVALIVFSPVVIWNFQHDWASFMFQSSDRFAQMKRLRLDFLFQLIGSQLGMLTPYVFFLLVTGWAAIGVWSIKEKNQPYSLLFWIALPVYAVFTLSSLRSLVKMNWLAPAYVTSVIAGLVWLNANRSSISRWFDKLFVPGIVLGLLIVVFMHVVPIIPIAPLKKGDTWSGWKELGQRIERLKTDRGEDVFVFGHEYKAPSEITYYTASHLPTHAGEIFGANGLQYNYWTDTAKLIGRDAIFVTSDADRFTNFKKLNKHFESIAPLDTLEIVHRNRTYRAFYFYLCSDYKGPKP
ncbi:MAG: ArnT family glycosyltransferase [Candidatus Zhuqueibacterota bacterium]